MIAKSPAARAKKLVRKAVVRYSIRNRKRKAAAISEYLDRHGAKTMLYVGSLGNEDTVANTNVVENTLVRADRRILAGINIHPRTTPYPFLCADGRHTPFADKYFDFALANAIIEHVGGEADQRDMIAEHTRVAHTWVITTPNRWFPIESHTSMLFAHWSPRWRAQRTEFTRLLSLREFRAMLPAGTKVVGRPWSATFTAYWPAD